MNSELRTKAVDLIGAVWSTMDHKAWAKQRLKIWTIFQERVEGNARLTNNLGAYVNLLAVEMIASPGNSHWASQQVASIVTSSEAPAILKLIRDEAATLVAMLRVRQEEKKAEREAAERNGVAVDDLEGV